MKATIKAVRGAAIIAQKYGVTLSHVLENELNSDNMVLELRADGYTWDTRSKRWLMSGAQNHEQKAQAVITLPCEIRIIAEDEIACGIAVGYIKAALKEAGYNIDKEGEVIKHFQGQGARVYLEVSL